MLNDCYDYINMTAVDLIISEIKCTIDVKNIFSSIWFRLKFRLYDQNEIMHVYELQWRSKVSLSRQKWLNYSWCSSEKVLKTLFSRFCAVFMKGLQHSSVLTTAALAPQSSQAILSSGFCNGECSWVICFLFASFQVFNLRSKIKISLKSKATIDTMQCYFLPLCTCLPGRINPTSSTSVLPLSPLSLILCWSG